MSTDAVTDLPGRGLSWACRSGRSGSAMRPRVPRVCTRRLGRVSARRAPVDRVLDVRDALPDSRPNFEKLGEHGFGSYWLRLSLQAHGNPGSSRRGLEITWIRRSASKMSWRVNISKGVDTVLSAFGQSNLTVGSLDSISMLPRSVGFRLPQVCRSHRYPIEDLITVDDDAIRLQLLATIQHRFLIKRNHVGECSRRCSDGERRSLGLRKIDHFGVGVANRRAVLENDDPDADHDQHP